MAERKGDTQNFELRPVIPITNLGRINKWQLWEFFCDRRSEECQSYLNAGSQYYPNCPRHPMGNKILLSCCGPTPWSGSANQLATFVRYTLTIDLENTAAQMALVGDELTKEHCSLASWRTGYSLILPSRFLLVFLLVRQISAYHPQQWQAPSIKSIATTRPFDF